MNKHSENNRARRICAKLRGLLHTLKTNEERIAAIQFNEELGAEEKTALIKKIQEQTKALATHKNRLENRAKDLAFEDTRPNPATRNGTHFVTHTEVIPERVSDEPRWTRISRRQPKCNRAFFTLQEAFCAH